LIWVSAHAQGNIQSLGGFSDNSVLDKGPASGSLSLLTLQPVQHVPIWSLDTKSGFRWSLSMSYSGNTFKNSRTPNTVSPASWVGLGWSMHAGFIFADQNQTRDINDDHWYFQTGDGVNSEILRNGSSYVLEKKPYWKVVPSVIYSGVSPPITNFAIITGWELTDENGTKYRFGDFSQDKPFNASWNLLTNTIHMAPSPCAAQSGCQSIRPIFNRWDLGEIEDVSHGKIKFTYQQFREDVDWKSYTRESYLKKVESDNGDALTFDLGDKDGNELPAFESPQLFKQFEGKYLSKITATDASGNQLDKIDFAYSHANIEPLHLNSTHRGIAKRMLMSISSQKNLQLNVDFDYSPGGFLMKRTDRKFGGGLTYGYGNIEVNKDLKQTLPLAGFTASDYANSVTQVKGNHIFVMCRGEGGHHTKLGIIDLVDNKWTQSVISSTLEAGTHIYPGQDYFVKTVKINDEKFSVQVWEWHNKKWIQGTFAKIHSYGPAVPDHRDLDLDELLSIVYPEQNYFIIHENTHPEQSPISNNPFSIPQSRKIYVYSLIDGKWTSTFNAPEGAEIANATDIQADFNHDANGEGWNFPEPIFGEQWRAINERIFTTRDKFVIQYGIGRFSNHAWGDVIFPIGHEFSCENCITSAREYFYEVYAWDGRYWNQIFVAPQDPIYNSPDDQARVTKNGFFYYKYDNVPGGISPLTTNNGLYRYSFAALRSNWDDYRNNDMETSPSDWVNALEGDFRVKTQFEGRFFLSTFPVDNGALFDAGKPRFVILKEDEPVSPPSNGHPYGPYSLKHANAGLDEVDPYTNAVHWPRSGYAALGKDYLMVIESPDGNQESWMMVYKWSESGQSWVKTVTSNSTVFQSTAHKLGGQVVNYTRVFPIDIDIMETYDDYFIVGNKFNRTFWIFRWNSSSGKWESKMNGSAGQLTDAQIRSSSGGELHSDKYGEGVRYPANFEKITPFSDHIAVQPLMSANSLNKAIPHLYYYDFAQAKYPDIGTVQLVQTNGAVFVDQNVVVIGTTGPALEVRNAFLDQLEGKPSVPVVQSIALSDGTSNPLSSTNYSLSDDADKQDFDCVNGVGYFGSITSKIGDGSKAGKTVSEIEFDYSTNLFGVPLRSSQFNASGSLVGKQEQAWEAKTLQFGAVEVYVPRMVHSVSTVHGVSTTHDYPSDQFDETNGSPKVSITTNSNGDALVTHTTFAHEMHPGVADAHILSGLAGQRTYLVDNLVSSSFSTEFSSGDFTVYKNPSRDPVIAHLSQELTLDKSNPNVDVPVNISGFSPALATLNPGDIVQVEFKIRTTSLFASDRVQVGLKINDVNAPLSFNDPDVGVILLPQTHVRAYVVSQSITSPAYLALNIRNIDETLKIDRMEITIVKNPTPSDKLVSANAFTWKQFGSLGWRQSEMFTWNVPMNGFGRPTMAFVPFNYGSTTNDSHWESKGLPVRFDDNGRVSEASRSDGFRTVNIYGYSVGHNVGGVVGASFDECGILNGDYDLNEAIETGGASSQYFDKANGWEKAGGVLNSTQSRFGNNSIYVENAFGPTRNFKIYPGKDYILSAWVKVISGKLTMGGDYRKLAAGATTDFPFSLGSHQKDFGNIPIVVQSTPEAGWQYVELKIPAATDLSGNDWYARIFVGTPEGGMAYINDVRLYPSDALVTSAYFDPTFRRTIARVDANNNAVYFILDNMGRVKETRNNQGQTTTTTSYNLVGD
jgi:hypothetical protein